MSVFEVTQAALGQCTLSCMHLIPCPSPYRGRLDLGNAHICTRSKAKVRGRNAPLLQAQPSLYPRPMGRWARGPVALTFKSIRYPWPEDTCTRCAPTTVPCELLEGKVRWMNCSQKEHDGSCIRHKLLQMFIIFAKALLDRPSFRP